MTANRTALGTAALVAGSLILLTEAAIEPGSPAPNFKLQDMAGRTVQLCDLRGRAVILHFWASWCPRCVEEMPLLQEVNRDYGARGVRVLALNLAEAPRRVGRYLKAHGLDLQILLDPKGDVAAKYGVTGLPMTIVIDPQGQILSRISMGSLDRNGIDTLLAPFLTPPEKRDPPRR